MPTLRIKSGGVWRTVTNGNLRIKKDGVWQGPSFCRVKSGGAWQDSGYKGPPTAPTGLKVNAWDLSHVHTEWTAPTTGTPVDHYVAAIRDVNGNTVSGQPDRNETGLISYNWNVSPDTKWQFYVRAVGADGQSSPWVGPLKVGIGHAISYGYGYVERTRGWGAGGDIGYSGYLNNFAGFAVPPRVLCTIVHWALYMSVGVGTISVYPPDFVDGGDRYVEIIVNGGVWERPTWYNPTDGFDGVNSAGGLIFWGNGQGTGIIPRNGSDNNAWDASPWGRLYVLGSIGLGGTEYYDNYEITATYPAVANYYW